ncbi:MAG: DNA glycosylase [Thermoplasmata archaeon]
MFRAVETSRAEMEEDEKSLAPEDDREGCGSADMKYIIEPENPLNVDLTLESGQAFRWRKEGEVWVGVVREKVCRVAQQGNVVTFTGFSMEEFLEYFGLKQDMREVVEESFRRPEVSHLPGLYRGLRILNQEFYESLVSFMLATNTNIQRIKGMVEKLCGNFGRRIVDGGKTYFTFPGPEKLLECPGKLNDCGLGFRRARILELAEKILDGKLNLERIAGMDYAGARASLLAIKGVGEKVADCVSLFSLHHYMAFPIDVHIKSWFRKQNYRELECVNPELGRRQLKPGTYRILGDFARKRFGRFAGYVQQYIFLDELLQSARGKRPESTMQLPARNAAGNP